MHPARSVARAACTARQSSECRRTMRAEDLALTSRVYGGRPLPEGASEPARTAYFFVSSFFMLSFDIESFDIVSFFMVSSAKAAGASASPNDTVTADRMTAVRLIMVWQSPSEGVSRLGNGCHLPKLRMKPSLVTRPEKVLITIM